MPAVPTIQSAVSAQSGGLWLVFGGRTNGLHGFDPTGAGQLPAALSEQRHLRHRPRDRPDLVRALGRHRPARVGDHPRWPRRIRSSTRSATASTPSAATRSTRPTGDFQTYDTLSAISVRGLIDAVITQGAAVASVKQIHDPRLAVTGGDLAAIGNRTYLVFGQDFQGGYNGSTDSSGPRSTPTRSAASRSSTTGTTLAIAGYQAQRDPVNFRRRDGNLVPVVFPERQAGPRVPRRRLHRPAGGGYRNPIVIGPDGVGRVDALSAIFLPVHRRPRRPSSTPGPARWPRSSSAGSASTTTTSRPGTLTPDTNLPFVDDVTSLVRRADGSDREYIMPSQLPGLLRRRGRRSSPRPACRPYSNGVIKLDEL